MEFVAINCKVESSVFFNHPVCHVLCYGVLSDEWEHSLNIHLFFRSNLLCCVKIVCNHVQKLYFIYTLLHTKQARIARLVFIRMGKESFQLGVAHNISKVTVWQRVCDVYKRHMYSTNILCMVAMSHILARPRVEFYETWNV